MKKKFVVILALALLMISAFLTPAFAKSTTITYGIALGVSYTQIIGLLDGADYVIRIPEEWNGKLIVFSPWYRVEHNCHLDPRVSSLSYIVMKYGGYAFAMSDCGAEGYPIKEAMIRTHQLTEYILDNYPVTGKVYIMGASMGGNTALLLGVKYPDLYSGVLEFCGVKDCTALYNVYAYAAGLSLEQIRVLMGWPPTVPDATVQALKNTCIAFRDDLEVETGGNTETKPQAYERISPINNIDIEIPIISVVGQLDRSVFMSQHISYQAAVSAAGYSDLYRMYVVPNGGHLDTPIWAQLPLRLAELDAWSNSLD